MEESDLLPSAPVKPRGVLAEEPVLPGEWWTGLNGTLDALAAHRTSRIATPDTRTRALNRLGRRRSARWTHSRQLGTAAPLPRRCRRLLLEMTRDVGTGGGMGDGGDHRR